MQQHSFLRVQNEIKRKLLYITLHQIKYKGLFHMISTKCADSCHKNIFKCEVFEIQNKNRNAQICYRTAQVEYSRKLEVGSRS